MEPPLPAVGDALLPVRAGEVHLSYAATSLMLEPPLAAAYEALLSSEELRRVRAFKVDGARRAFILTRALVRTALSRHASIAPREWRFRLGPHGRPEIEGSSDLRFNASNCERMVACAVTKDAAVGVDAEPESAAASALEAGARVLSASEREALAALDAVERARLVLSLWTLKEAFLKARGVGLSSLSLSPHLVSFAVRGDDAVLESAPDVPCLAAWSFRLLDIDGHRVAIALDGPLARLEAWRAVPLVAFERD